MSLFDINGNQLGSVSDSQIESAVSDWLEANPDATTTVQDGAITKGKLADGAVAPEKTDFLLPSSTPVPFVCVADSSKKWSGYAGANNTLYNANYVLRFDGATTAVYACPVIAGKTYTIIPCIDTPYFCKSYSLDAPTDEVKEAWTRSEEMLGTLSYVNGVKLAGMFAETYESRQTKMRFVPTTDGYIVGMWHKTSGALVYEGANPNEYIEAYIDDAETEYTLSNYPFYNWVEASSERQRKLDRINPEPEMERLLRRGEYYQNLILSDFVMTCFGDSITFGSSVGVGNRYHDFLRAKLGINVIDRGINGATATTGYGMNVNDGTGVDGFISAYLQDLATDARSCIKDFDRDKKYVFSIELGTNDWIYNAPLGTYSTAADYDNTATYAVGAYCTYNGDQYICTTAVETAMEFDATYWSRTFFGCYKKLIARIRELYPNAAIILMTPWQQFYNDIHYYEANEAGHSVLDYNLAIHEIAMMTRNCWVLDMMNSAYITEKDNSPSGTYVDGVHIGRKAHILVAHELEKILMQVIMMNGYDYIPLTTMEDTFTGQK